MIGTVWPSRGLKFLDDDAFFRSYSRTSLLSSYFSIFETVVRCGISSWPSKFSIYEILFPHSFSKVDVSSLSCDVCVRAKQPQVPFPFQPYKPTKPFTLINNDVWRPSQVTTTLWKCWFVTFIDDHTRLNWVFLLLTDKYEVSSIFQQFYPTI